LALIAQNSPKFLGAIATSAKKEQNGERSYRIQRQQDGGWNLVPPTSAPGLPLQYRSMLLYEYPSQLFPTKTNQLEDNSRKCLFVKF